MISTVRFLLSLLCVVTFSSATAQTRATGSGFDLTAAGGIRFDATAGEYEATGEVQLVVSDWVVLADRVIARLDKAQQSVTELGGRGTVFIQNGTFKARADAVDLDVGEQTVRLTGSTVNVQIQADRLVTSGTVTFGLETGAVEVDDTFVLQLDGTSFTGGKARAQLTEGRVEEIAVMDGVRLEAPDLELAGERLSLVREDGVLRLEGGVVVRRGSVLLSGAAAFYDLATGTVRLSNDGDNRVSGVLSFQ